MTVMLQSGPGVSAAVLVELDRVWWHEYAGTFPAVFLSESPSQVWCELHEGLLERLILPDHHICRATDSVLSVSASGDRRIAVLPAAALSPFRHVSTYLGLDGVPSLVVMGKVFTIELTASLYVDRDGRLGAPRGSFLERWGPADLLRIREIADYWR